MRAKAEYHCLRFSYGDNLDGRYKLSESQRDHPMAVRNNFFRWLRLPGRAALILGLGALTPAVAQADAPDQSDRTASGGVSVWSSDGKIYLSEGGRETELPLGATPERDRLMQLLQDHGPSGVKLDPDPRLIMSGGGGSGFSLRDIQRSLTNEPPPAPQNPPQTGSPKREPAPRNNKPASDKKGWHQLACD